MANRPIIFVSHEFPPLGGGAGINGAALCEELYRRGYPIRVIAQRGPGGGADAFPFPVFRVPSMRKFEHQTSFTSMLLFIAGALGAGMRRCGRASCIVSNMAIPAGIAGTLLAGVFRIPHYIWHHGSDVHAGKASGASSFQKMLLRVLWRRSCCTCFVSQSLLDLARSYGGLGRACVLPIAPAAGCDRQRAVPSDNAPYLFLGRMERVKNPLLAVDAFAALRSQGFVRRRMLMAGDGSLYGLVQHSITARGLGDIVGLRKNLGHAEALRTLQSAYALLCCSAIEGFSTTVLEAAGFGVPAIGADVPGINDFVKHRRTGLLFRPGDAAGLSDCIRALDAAPGFRDELGTSAFQSVQQYTIGKTADIFEEEARAGKCFQS